MLTVKLFVLVLRLAFIRKIIVTRLLSTNAAMLTKEIPDVSAIETAGEHDGRSSKLSIVELFMFSCWPWVTLLDVLTLQEMVS